MTDFTSEYTVLVVDDLPTDITLVQVILKKEGYSLLTANNGVKALQLARERRPNIILLDTMMPGMDGYEVLRQLKTNPDTNHIPVIIMSALNDMPSIIKGYQLGATEYVTKPFQREELVKRIAHRFKLYTVERYRQELEATMESRDMLYSIISRDLRTPLGALKMMNHSILRMLGKDTVNETVYEMLLTMNKTSEEAFQLLDNLTKWSKFTRKKIRPHKQKTQISSLVESIVDVYNPIAELKKVRISLQDMDTGLSGRVDADMLKTILRNLLSHVINAGRQGDTIRISMRQSGDYLLFSIKNSGGGIKEKEDKAAAFDINENHTADLSLWVCKIFVELHEGKLEIEPGRGESAAFFFSIKTDDEEEA
ncbi:MAG: hybrid sensor histidine kinase/response regulator [Tannerellaceae bacterium]|jgi:two-component system sensor histidine kinase/response regulator|nr:hybrid sensor histidine kinase/response regulator [Tannerellaceae bacterium]